MDHHRQATVLKEGERGRRQKENKNDIVAISRPFVKAGRQERTIFSLQRTAQILVQENRNDIAAIRRPFVKKK